MAQPPPLPKSARPLRHVRVLFLASVVLLLGGLLGWHLAYRIGNARAVTRLETAVRAKQEPLTVAEVAARYGTVPEPENAAVPLMELWEADDPAYWRAFRQGAQRLPAAKKEQYDPKLPFFGNSRPALDLRHQPIEQEASDVMRRFLTERSNHLAAVRLALQRPKFRVPLRFNDGYLMLLPHLGRLKKEAQVFQLEALWATEEGKVSVAIDALANAAKIGHLLEDDTILIGQLVRIACYRVVLSGAETLMNRTTPTDAELLRLSELLGSLRLDGNFKQVLLTERAMSLMAFDEPEQLISFLADSPTTDGESKVSEFRLADRVLVATGLKTADRRLLLETYASVLPLADRKDPLADRWIGRILDGAVAQAKRPPWKIVTGMMLPALAKSGERFAWVDALRRSAEVAVAVERFRLLHSGALPASLGELTPQLLSEVPLDPFNGNQLQYRRLEKGFVVYSVGGDRVDHQGREAPAKGRKEDFDVGFRVER